MSLRTTLDRRTLLATLAFTGASALLPKTADADDIANLFHLADDGATAFAMLSEQEQEHFLLEKAHIEAQEIIDAAVDSLPAFHGRGRPKYWTKYGTTQKKTVSRRDVAGQPLGGINIGPGGYAHVSASGGGSVSVSVALPGGVGSIGVSIPLPRRALYATAYGVKIPAGKGYYKVTTSPVYSMKPYVVYETINKVTKVYRKMCAKELYSLSLDIRRIK